MAVTTAAAATRVAPLFRGRVIPSATGDTLRRVQLEAVRVATPLVGDVLV
jgi:hypothetical protein